jgi:hypothetical protein
MADRITLADQASAHHRHISQLYQWCGLTRLSPTHNLTHVWLPGVRVMIGPKSLILPGYTP